MAGQPLPLISKGGTSTLINCAYIGMILSVSRYVAEPEEKKAAEQQALEEVNGNRKLDYGSMQEQCTGLKEKDSCTGTSPAHVLHWQKD